MLACPPTVGYRLRKLARQHKRSVVAASLVLLALVGGIIGGVGAGLAGKGIAEAVNPSHIDEADNAYWRENYKTRPYAQHGGDYEEFAPAYGVDHFDFYIDFVQEHDPVNAATLDRLTAAGAQVVAALIVVIGRR